MVCIAAIFAIIIGKTKIHANKLLKIVMQLWCIILLSNRVGITMANISVLKNGKAKAVRLSTLNAICKALQCQPGDILEYVDDGEDESEAL